MNRTILGVITALTFLAVPLTQAAAQSIVVGTQDFEGGTFDFGFAFSELGSPTFTSSSVGNGNASANALAVTADLSTTTGSSFAGFGGGFGLFGVSLLPTPSALSDFGLDFDILLDGLTTPGSPINGVAQLVFRIPDVVADGDDGGSDNADNLFQVNNIPFQATGVNGVYESLSVNVGGGTVQIATGGTPENNTVSFADFINGDALGRDFSQVNELLVQFQISDGLAFGDDAGNSFLIDNVSLTQQAQVVPEPSSLVALLSLGMLGGLRRRR